MLTDGRLPLGDDGDLIGAHVGAQGQLADQAAVDLLDDFQMARGDAAQQIGLPHLQCLWHQRVVGVTERRAGQLQRPLPWQPVHVDQQAHELGRRQRGMRIVEMDGNLVGQPVPVGAMVTQEAGDEILHRCRSEEVLLPQAQLAPLWRAVVRIEETRHRLGADLRGDRLEVFAAVELAEIETRHRPRAPQPQRVDGGIVVARHQQVVGHGDDALRRMPYGAVIAMLDVAAEADGEGRLGALQLPHIAVGQPVVRLLHLPAVGDLLAEHAVLVADAVAETDDIATGHRFQEAGGEAAEAAVAERRLGFELDQVVERDAHARQRLGALFAQARRHQRAFQLPRDEEFHRQVADLLLAGAAHARVHGVEAIDDAAADGQRGGAQPFARRGVDARDADVAGQLAQKLALQLVNLASGATVLHSEPPAVCLRPEDGDRRSRNTPLN